MNFRVGQKVVCVSGPFYHPVGVVQPTIGEVYTIRAIVDGLYLGEEVIGVVLSEIHNEISWTGVEFNFLPIRFRPVVERKTDISFAHEILRKATKPAPATPVALQESKCDQ